MKPFLILITAFLCARSAWAQSHEIGIFIGGSNYQGDLAPSFAPNEFNPAAGIFFKRNYNGFWSRFVSLHAGKLSGSDQNFKNQQSRNLNFQSLVVELSTGFEFNFNQFVLGLRAKKYSPYVGFGIGAFYFNPKGELNGNWYALRKLSTEGQGIGGPGKSYSFISIATPMTVGLKWQIARRVNLNCFAGFRYTLTDYIDDVSTQYFDNAIIQSKKGDIAAALANKSIDSQIYTGKQRGNPQRNDWYLFTGITLSIILPDEDCYNFHK